MMKLFKEAANDLSRVHLGEKLTGVGRFDKMTQNEKKYNYSKTLQRPFLVI